ncbi:MAG: hypothetical protein JWM80_5500 [Cyanobacteria bacterium RYN_339]|nr:hypothetical protein [Cyanobacteria bacterium RYN_339]
MIDDRRVRREILDAGMRGLFTVPQLVDGQVTTAPEAPGLYAVWRIAETLPRFARTSTAGRHQGRDPTLSQEDLLARWVPDAALLYVAKTANIRTRIRLLMDFAVGKPVAHWDGRALWQLSDADDLLVAWRTVDPPNPALADLLARFEATHNRPRPFANEK